MDFSQLISFVIAVFVLAIAPGPDNIFVLTQSLVHGRKQGMATVFGLMTGCLVHTTLVAFGASTLLITYPFSFTLLRFFGVAYMLFLAYTVFKSDVTSFKNPTHSPKKSYMQLFRQGFFMNVLNPKVSLFFLAFFPGFLFTTQLSTVAQFYVLGGLFIATSFTVFTSIAFLAGSIASKILKKESTGIYFKWLQILVFLGIAMFLLF